MQHNIEPRAAKRLGIFASYSILAMSSVAYGTAAWGNASGFADQASAAGMAAAPGLVALGALATALSSRNRRQTVAAGLVGGGALVIQSFNGFGYWMTHDQGVKTATARWEEAIKAEAKHTVTPSAPIEARISSLQEEGGPKERRAIRAQRRELGAALAEAKQTEVMHTSLKARVTESAEGVKAAKADATFGVLARTFVMTAIEAIGPGAMALSVTGKGVPAPAPAPQSDVRPGALLARRRWDKRTVINEIPA